MSAVATAAGGAHPGGSSDRAATAPGAGVPSREPRVGKWKKVGGLEKLPNWTAAHREALHTEYQAHPFVLGSDPNVTTFKASLLARLDGLPGGSPSANDIKVVTAKLVEDMLARENFSEFRPPLYRNAQKKCRNPVFRARVAFFCPRLRFFT